MMKKYLFTIALLSSQIITVAQTVNVHFKNGQQIQYSTYDVDFVDFSEKFEDTPGGNGPINYTIDGKTYTTVLVNGGDMPPFYMMQTEIVPDKKITVGYDELSYSLDDNKDGVLAKTELRAFLYEIRRKTGLPWRLPTKEEWLFAASGGAKSQGYKYSGSNSIPDVAWYKDNSQNKAHDIAGKKSNELGLYDMSGNYAELVIDELTDEYSPDGNYYGGSWQNQAYECTVTSFKEGETTGKITYQISEKNAVSCEAVTVRLVYTK